MVEVFERESLFTRVLSPCYNRILGAEEFSVQDFVGITPQDNLTQYSSSLEG